MWMIQKTKLILKIYKIWNQRNIISQYHVLLIHQNVQNNIYRITSNINSKQLGGVYEIEKIYEDMEHNNDAS